MMPAAEARSARLLFDDALQSGAVDERALDHPAVHRAVAPGRTAVRPVRFAQRVMMKRDRLTFEGDSLEPMERARRAVLGEQSDPPPRVLIRVDEFPHWLTD